VSVNGLALHLLDGKGIQGTRGRGHGVVCSGSITEKQGHKVGEKKKRFFFFWVWVRTKQEENQPNSEGRGLAAHNSVPFLVPFLKF